MEAVILAGGKAERLGTAARGRPKALVEIAGRPLAAHQVALLVDAGVERVLVSCAAGQEGLFEAELAGLGAEVVVVPEREPLGRGGGIRLAASVRQDTGDLYALNGDELIDADAVNANYENGLLSITLPLATRRTEPVHVEISGSET